MNEAPPAEPARDPLRAAQANMRPARIKRFYRTAGVGEVEGGFALLLDGRRALTPAKKPLILPSRALAEAIAEEWAGQGEALDLAAMPLTRLGHSALDGVAAALGATRADIAGYAAADLVCYRAEGPAALAAAEAEAFDPVLDWAEAALGAKFRLAAGVVHVRQPARALAAVGAAVASFEDPFALAALQVMTTLAGSVLIALAVARRRLSAEEAWRIAHVGEDFQIAQWGEDEEAKARRAARWRDFQAAAQTIAAA
ncbi:MAG: ATP12 family protein [Roseiarcus sp.]|jgi:chaperone required for assembly of F1-ATPase